jgi:hypothetical protein
VCEFYQVHVAGIEDEDPKGGNALHTEVRPRARRAGPDCHQAAVDHGPERGWLLWLPGEGTSAPSPQLEALHHGRQSSEEHIQLAPDVIALLRREGVKGQAGGLVRSTMISVLASAIDCPRAVPGMASMSCGGMIVLSDGSWRRSTIVGRANRTAGCRMADSPAAECRIFRRAVYAGMAIDGAVCEEVGALSS